MPTKQQNEGRRNFLNYSDRYDNLDIFYYGLKNGHIGYSYVVQVFGTRKVQFRIAIQKNFRYRVVTEEKSKVNVPKELSSKRFDTPEDALDAIANYLRQKKYRVYKSNAIDFILHQ